MVFKALFVRLRKSFQDMPAIRRNLEGQFPAAGFRIVDVAPLATDRDLAAQHQDNDPVPNVVFGPRVQGEFDSD